MIITKDIRSTIDRDYFFIKGNIEIPNLQYLINKIEQGINEKNNMNYTIEKLIGKMTHDKYFVNDPVFLDVFIKMLNKFNHFNKEIPYTWTLNTAWGVKQDKGDYTDEHTHVNSLGSGVLYLSDVEDHSTDFSDLNEKVEQKVGNFCFFSSFLFHNSKRVEADKPKYLIAFNLDYVS